MSSQSVQPPNQQKPRERICKTCAWFKPSTIPNADGICQWEPQIHFREENKRCRHHAFTTGWLEEEEEKEEEKEERQPIQWAPNMPPAHYSFEAMSPDEKELLNLIETYWQKYLILCRDWELAKKR